MRFRSTHTEPMTQTHTVFGAGQVGSLLAQHLLAQGHHVRIVRRGQSGDDAPNLTWMRGDASDPSFADQACAGADVVYNCTNPSSYAGWDGVLQPLFTAIRDAAGRADARLVVLGNLYMYGRPPVSPFNEDTPMNPCSRKGELRAQLAAELFDAHRRGDVRATVGRASDYISPTGDRAVIFNKRFFDRLPAGKPVEVFGDPTLPRAYSYVGDVARHLAILGADARSEGKVWHLPVTNTGSTIELIEQFAAAAGVRARTRRIPRWLLRTVGVFVKDIGAAVEMMYQWETPYVPDDSRFRQIFGESATPIDALAQQLLSPAAAQGALARAGLQ